MTGGGAAVIRRRYRRETMLGVVSRRVPNFLGSSVVPGVIAWRLLV